MRKHGENGKFVPLCDKPLKKVLLKLDPDELDMLDDLAKKKGMNRTDLIRLGIKLVLEEVC